MAVGMVFRSAVQQDVQVRADVHVAQLERPSQGEGQRYVFGLGGLCAYDFDVRWWSGG